VRPATRNGGGARSQGSAAAWRDAGQRIEQWRELGDSGRGLARTAVPGEPRHGRQHRDGVGVAELRAAGCGAHPPSEAARRGNGSSSGHATAGLGVGKAMLRWRLGRKARRSARRRGRRARR
jgi:hypothetical protein